MDGPSGPATASSISLQHIAQVELSYRPQGLAITPDGTAVVVSTFWGRETYLLDAETYSIRARVPTGQSWGIEISPTGDRAFIAGRGYLQVYSLPDLALLNVAETRTRRAVTDVRGVHYYASGHIPGVPLSRGAVVKLDPSGDIVATHPVDVMDNNGLALSLDSSELYAIDQIGNLHVFRASNLRPLRVLNLNRWSWLVIPLLAPGKLALVGGEHEGPEVVVLDARTGAIEHVDHVPRRRGPALLNYGYGNAWTRMGDRIVIGSTHGLLIIDAMTGRIDQLVESEALDVIERFCCEVAYDSYRDRLLVTGMLSGADPSFEGTLKIFQVIRR